MFIIEQNTGAGEILQVYKTLAEAKSEGYHLGRRGAFPTVYSRGRSEFILVPCREVPPAESWPVLKWVGMSSKAELYNYDWIPVLSRLDSIHNAKLACGLFHLLGYEPVIVEYRNRGVFDIFIKESLIPDSDHVVKVTAPNCSVLHLHATPKQD